MATLSIRFAFLAPTILTATLGLAEARAWAQGEAATEAGNPAPADEAAKPAADEAAHVAPAAEVAKPAEPPKCDCPPPCPAPPPPPAAAADAVEWKAQSKGGLLVTGGNSQSKNFTFGLNGSRKEGKNKLALEGGLTYGTSNNTVATVDSSTNTVVGVDRNEVVSNNNWGAKGRYDRFVTDNNAAFATGQAAADKIAGKTFFGGGQLGYSRQVLKDTLNTVVAELGYDFSYERYVDAGAEPVFIHSARVLVGETLSLNKETGVTASVEALFNLAKEKKALNAKDGTTGVDALKDTRVNGKLALTTNLWEQLSFGFSFGFKYDQNPAPRPIPAGAGGAHWPAQYWSLAYAQRWDTITEATMIYTFF